jgi:transcriptional regulator with XRE-family HTH domain
MRKSVHSENQAVFQALLVEARRKAGLTQETVARSLGRHQSFVAKYEGGERRLDMIEFIEVARALKADPSTLFRQLLRRLPS